VYEFAIEPTVRGDFVYTEQQVHRDKTENQAEVNRSLGKGHDESTLKHLLKGDPGREVAQSILESVSWYTVYHFNDTSDEASIRRACSVRDVDCLRETGANLAAFLLYMRDHHQGVYENIRDTVRLAAPFFDDFKFRPRQSEKDITLQLEWTQKDSDYPFLVSQLSDGTLRFIAFATALLQPSPPATILLDEPELGLHPYALDLLAALMKEAATRTQIIVSTQSASLLDSFEAEDIVVVQREEGASTFRRLSSGDLTEWMKDYSLGELWRKNVIEGGPTYE